MTPWLKSHALTIVLGAAAALAPIKPVVLASLALVVIDALTGVWAAQKRGEKITSAGLRRSVSKSIVYSCALLVAQLTGVYLLSNLVPVVALVGGAIGLVEGKSCLENLNTVYGGNLFKAAIAGIGSVNDKTPPK